MSAIIYLHGFLSSPQSLKAQQTEHWLQVNRPDIDYYCPYISPYPEKTQQQLQELLQHIGHHEVGLIGSSLGGFWSTWIVEQYGHRAVLINPSVTPHKLVERVLDIPQYSYHTHDSYVMTVEHEQQFLQAYPAQLNHLDNYWVLLQTGDETLDYRDAVDRYKGCRQLVEEDGDHGFQGYEEKIERIVDFLFPVACR